MRVCLCVSVSVCVCVCIRVCVCFAAYLCVSVYVYVRVFLLMFVCSLNRFVNGPFGRTRHPISFSINVIFLRHPNGVRS